MKISYYYHSDDMPFASMAKQHYHADCAEIYYLEKGECGYFIEDRTYHAIAGDVIIIPPNVIHKTTYKAPYARRLLSFNLEVLSNPLKDAFFSMIYIYRNYNIQSEIKSLFKKIHEEHKSPDKYSNEVLKLYLSELIYLLARNTNNVDGEIYSSPFVAETARYILENYAEEITLSSVSKIMNVSHEHLSRTFKKDTGLGFNEYLNLVRLKKADEMLRSESHKSISEIAICCGFNDSNYFSDKFKSAYGVSPINYRKKN